MTALGSAAARPTLVLAALAEELKPLLARTEVSGRDVLDGYTVAWGELDGAPIVAALSGVGPEPARRAASHLLRRLQVARLLVIGISGGLSPELGVGDVLVGTTVRNGLDTAPPPDPEWVAQALQLGDVRGGTLATSEHLLPTAASKREGWRALGEESPAAVDMETASFAEEAAAKGVPYLAVRAVVDAADEDLPLDFARFRTPDGRIRRARVACHALLHPGAVRHLLRLRSRVALCARRLAECARQLVADPQLRTVPGNKNN